MAVIAVLQTIVEASTQGFERGMSRASSAVTGFGQVVAERGGAVAGTFAHLSAVATGLSVLSQSAGSIGRVTAQLYVLFQAGTAAVNIMQSLGRAGAGLAGALGALGAAPLRAVGSAFSTLGSAVEAAGAQLWNMAKSAFGIALDAGKALVGPLLSALGVVASVVGQFFTTAFNEALKVAGSALAGTTGGITAGVSAIATALGAAIGAAVVAAIGAIGAPVVAVIGTIVLAVPGMLAGLTAAIAAPFIAAFAVVTGAALALVAGLAAILSPIVGIVGTIAAGAGAVLAAGLTVAVATIGALTGGLLALGAAATGAAMLLSHFGAAGAESIKEIKQLASQVGFTTEAMSSMASTLNVEAGSFAHSVIHMQRGIAEASEHSSVALSKLGLSIQSLAGQSAEGQIEAIYGAFGTLTSQADRASVAMALFGRSGIQMLESLNRGGAGLAAARERAARFGLVFSEAEGDAVRLSLKSWGQWGLAMEGVSRRLAIAFAPVWTDLGNLGGLIGEKLVAVFSDPQLVGAAQGVWSAIKDTAVSAWEAIASAGKSALDYLFGAGTITAANIKDVFVQSFITIEYALRNIGPLAQQAWDEIQLAAVLVAQAAMEAVNIAIDWINAAIPAVQEAVLTGVGAVTDGINAMIGGLNSALARVMDFIGPVIRVVVAVGIAFRLMAGIIEAAMRPIISIIQGIFQVAADSARFLVRMIADQFNVLRQALVLLLNAVASQLGFIANAAITALNLANRLNPLWQAIQGIELPTLQIPEINLQPQLDGAAAQVAAFKFPALEMPGIDLGAWVLQLKDQAAVGGVQLAESFAAHMRRRLQELSIVTPAGGAGPTTAPGGNRQPAEVRAAEAGSQDAFSVIYGKQNEALGLARRTAAATERGTGELREINRRLDRNPVIGVAAL